MSDTVAGNLNNTATSISSEYADEVSPLNHHIIGLCPQYWSFVPCLVQDIHQLMLINGVDCMVGTEDASVPLKLKSPGIGMHAKRTRTDLSNPNNYHKVLPISKCILCGIISYAHTRTNGTTQYLLDDGSGSIDCISWEDSQSSLYSLPSLDHIKNHIQASDYHHHGISNTNDNISVLTGKRRRMEQKLNTEYVVGDCVKIYGRIRCISLLNQTMTVIQTPDGNWEGKKCVR